MSINAVRYAEAGIEIQILRVAEGVSIPPRFAAIFCIMKVKDIIFFLPVEESTRYPKGQEGEQRHIVCNEHGADEGDVDKGEHGHARALLQSPTRRRATAKSRCF